MTDKKPTPEQPQPSAKNAETLDNPAAELDFGKLDLTVERVEERINPSETNVFDK